MARPDSKGVGKCNPPECFLRRRKQEAQTGISNSYPYYEERGNKCKHVREIENFQEKQKLPKLTQEEIKDKYNQTIRNTESVIRNLPLYRKTMPKGHTDKC